jgi:hypothetical protein
MATARKPAVGKPVAAAGKPQTAAATAEQTAAGSRHRGGDAVTVEQRRLHETLLWCVNTAAAAVNADRRGFGNADRRNGCGGGVGHAVGEVMVGCRMVVMKGVLRRQQLLDRGPRHLHNTETLTTHRLTSFPVQKNMYRKRFNLNSVSDLYYIYLFDLKLGF